MSSLKIPFEKDYKKNLMRTIEVLFKVHNELLGQMVNLATSETIGNSNKYISEDNATDLKYEDFIDLSDTNVQHLIEVIELVKDKMKVILNETLEK